MKDINLLIKNGVNVEKSMDIFGDMATYDETLLVFLSEVESKIAKIRNFKETGNMAEYAILVHSLKSDAKYFGFETLAELAYHHEMESKANHVYYVYENYDELMRETNRIINLVKSYLNELTPNFSEEKINKIEEVVTEENMNKILIVDDSDIIRTVIEKIFSNEYEILSANDGKEAIEIIENFKDTNLVGMLLDIYMPNVDGFGVLDYFRKNDLFDKVPVSIITGNDSVEIDQKVFEYPIVDVLKKPFNEANIKSVVERTVKKEESRNF